MKKRYPECDNPKGCALCSLSNYGKDCKNNPVNPIAFYRTQRGLTLEQLGKLIGTSRQNIWNIESGNRKIENITLSMAIKIADALEIEDLRDLILEE